MQLRKIKKGVNILGYLIAGVIIFITLLPQSFFKYSMEYGTFKVYSNFHLDNKVNDVVDKAVYSLRRSELYDSSHKQDVFICNNSMLFTLFALFSYDAFAVNNPITNNIFIADANLEENISSRSSTNHRIRSLSGVLAHETCHSLLRNELGFFKYKFLPSWKNEGYCDFIAQESSVQDNEGIESLCNGDSDSDTKPFQYFRYRQYIKYLITEKKQKLSFVLSESYDLDVIDKQTFNYLCSSINE